ncbi:hypothetical protein DP939_24015 [Spongiactinospora rosea]|uniref:Uncharacterized protein n=1 Tax=Spongiactinospora rosea TaxID=2248750 RepID=A0A366LUL3_9ACTN|nr:hypothetical protein DP939_24015 [Spongiactinospora rosea]
MSPRGGAGQEQQPTSEPRQRSWARMSQGPGVVGYSASAQSLYNTGSSARAQVEEQQHSPLGLGP